MISGSRDKTLKLWDVGTGVCLYTFIGHDSWVRDVCWHPAGKYFISASDDKTIRVWDVTNKRLNKTLESHKHFCTCIGTRTLSQFFAIALLMTLFTLVPLLCRLSPYESFCGQRQRRPDGQSVGVPIASSGSVLSNVIVTVF